MRNFLTCLLALAATVLVAQNVFPPAFWVPAQAAGGGCTTPASATFNEGFEGTGYENTGWTTNNAGDVNPDYADAPSSGCSQSFKVGYGGSAAGIARDLGSSRVNIGGSFYFKAVAIGGAALKGGIVAITQGAYFFAPFQFDVKTSSGNPELWLEGSTSTNWTGLSVGTWYLVKPEEL